MTKEQFIELLISKDREEILYQYHLDYGKKKLTKNEVIQYFNRDFPMEILQAQIEGHFISLGFTDIINFIITHYYYKFNISVLSDSTGKFIQYL